ncbi:MULTISPECIES: phage major capsid protein [Erysipelotrichaceae]|uniref:Phage major capsid protein n=1 Tax=[Eubacterium] hominis TaxID=2764325 RepID=A0A7G9GNN0_9FIRM|nr:phage major capsid protein [Absiella sp. AM27-20]QNM12412.1 phage major capsid protein [[Eubacterium] hominis]RHU10657.1 phage major capsid protein [Absiella sp. AM27-20]
MPQQVVLKDQLQGFVPTEKATGIMGFVAKGSALIPQSKLEPMTAPTKEFTFWANTPSAYWVGEGKRIKTSVASFLTAKMEAHKIGVIIPCTKEKLNDTIINVFEEMKEPIADAIQQKVDMAGLFGIDSPFQFNLYDNAVKNGMYIVDGTNGALDLDVSDVMALVEDEGMDVTGFIAHTGIKNRLRKLRDGDGNQLYVDGTNTREFYNVPITFAKGKASFDREKAQLFAGDWSKSLVGVYQGLEYEVLKEATLQDTLWTDGKPLSLAEQDMIALKVTARFAFLPVNEKAFAILATKDTTPGQLGIMSIASYPSVSVAGKTVIVGAEATTGNTLLYLIGDSLTMPKYHEELADGTDGWKAWDGKAEIEAESGEVIIVAEIDATGQAVRAGKAVISVK